MALAQLRPGVVICRPVEDFKGLEHWGIVVAVAERDDLAVHLTKTSVIDYHGPDITFAAVRKVSLETFLGKSPHHALKVVTTHPFSALSAAERQTLINNAEKFCSAKNYPTEYHPVDFNCQTFVHNCRTGKVTRQTVGQARNFLTALLSPKIEEVAYEEDDDAEEDTQSRLPEKKNRGSAAEVSPTVPDTAITYIE